MINISKKLHDFLYSDAKKYFYIYEYRLSNENIVSNSIRIRESISQGDVLKYGPMDSACLEIDVDTKITEGDIITLFITDGTFPRWEDKFGYENDHVFSLGMFKVDTCEKKSKNLYHITAYREYWDESYAPSEDSKTNTFEEWKFSQKILYPWSFDQFLPAMFMGKTYDEFVWYSGMVSPGGVFGERTLELMNTGRESLEVKGYVLDLLSYIPSGYDSQYGLIIRAGKQWNENYNSAKAIIQRWDASYPKDWWNISDKLLALFKTEGGAAYVGHDLDYFANNKWNKEESYFKVGEEGWFYPYGGAYTATQVDANRKESYYLFFPCVMYEYNINQETGEKSLRNALSIVDYPEVSWGMLIYDKTLYPWLNKSIDATLRKQKSVTSNNQTFYSADGNLNYENLFISYNELTASFQIRDRLGECKRVRIKEKQHSYICNNNVYPSDSLMAKGFSVLPSETLSVNVLGEEISPYTHVEVKYLDGAGNETTQMIATGDQGATKVYDMTNNEVLLKYTYWDDDITDWITQYFIPHLKNSYYVPCEAEIVGLPTLELGDRIMVSDESGKYYETVILSRELRGDQFMKDTYSNRSV